MITHLFYHQETVEIQCVLNSWISIRDFFLPDDEVIILDMGNTLKKALQFKITPKFIRFEKIRTDKPEERSYTYGLNEIIPNVRSKWIVLWRSDYVYHKKYIVALRNGMKMSNLVLPYEAYVGEKYAKHKWCKKHLQHLMNGDLEFILKHSVICPVYETMDFPHFAIKKSLWIDSGGMNKKLWGYGFQFPEFFLRMKKRNDYKTSVQYEMIAFHQNHLGTFSLGLLNKEKRKELEESKQKNIQVFGSEEAYNNIRKEVQQKPLRPRWPDEYYRIRSKNSIFYRGKRFVLLRINKLKQFFK